MFGLEKSLYAFIWPAVSTRPLTRDTGAPETDTGTGAGLAGSAFVIVTVIVPEALLEAEAVRVGMPFPPSVPQYSLVARPTGSRAAP